MMPEADSSDDFKAAGKSYITFIERKPRQNYIFTIH